MFQDKDMGVPIPVIYYEDGTYRVLEKSELPVVLPYNVNLDCKGNSLLNIDEWRKMVCLKHRRMHLEKQIHWIHLLIHHGITFVSLITN